MLSPKLHLCAKLGFTTIVFIPVKGLSNIPVSLDICHSVIIVMCCALGVAPTEGDAFIIALISNFLVF